MPRIILIYYEERCKHNIWTIYQRKKNNENTQSINHQLKTENEIQIIRSITHKHKNPHNRNASQEILTKLQMQKQESTRNLTQI